MYKPILSALVLGLIVSCCCEDEEICTQRTFTYDTRRNILTPRHEGDDCRVFSADGVTCDATIPNLAMCVGTHLYTCSTEGQGVDMGATPACGSV